MKEMDLGVPRFSAGEMSRRRSLVEAAMARAGVDHLVAYGADRSGSAVQWICGWPVTREAALVVAPGARDVLFVQFYNHLPNARRLAAGADVRWGGPATFDSVAELLEARGATRVGLVGPIGYRGHQRLATVAEPVPLDAAYTEMRLVKSLEEIEWLARGSALSDAAIIALKEHATPGASELELVAAIEAAYLAEGGTTHIHYLGVTAMEEPASCVPAQWPTDRRLRAGDVVTAEISASWWGYPGQVLRTITVDSAPTPLYAELHAVADAALDAVLGVIRPGARPIDVVNAAGVIEDAGFTIYDDLLHGYGGGYFPPVLRTAATTHRPLPDIEFVEGMTVVVQPNVITPDERAGVQTGELVAVGSEGPERLHAVPRGLWRGGGG